MGVILFYLLWPFVWFYAPLFLRTRVLIIVDDEVLMVMNWFGPGSWQLPGGGTKFGEKPQVGALREIQEELGLEIPINELKQLNNEPIIIHRVGLIFREKFYVYYASDKPEIKLSRELTASAWLPISDPALPATVRSLL